MKNDNPKITQKEKEIEETESELLTNTAKQITTLWKEEGIQVRYYSHIFLDLICFKRIKNFEKTRFFDHVRCV